MELREKLRLALAAAPVRRASSLPSPPPRRSTGTNSGELSVDRHLTDLGEVQVAEEHSALAHRHGQTALAKALAISETALARVAPGIDSSDLERAAFLDIETTGLAGGSGTLAFLVGVATFQDEGLRLRQFFLASPAGEQALLAELSKILNGCRAIVSFNGRCFDVLLLETRFVVNRLRPPFGRMEHVDLLFAARRLYGRRLSSCRLGAIEREVLGVRRESHVPGWLVPRVYFDYLRYGDTGLMSGVFLHNKLDVLSLVTLLAHIGEVAGRPDPGDPDVCLAVARWDEAQGRLTDAADLYRRAAEHSLGAEERRFAVTRLVRVLRRLGRWDDMERMLLNAVVDTGASDQGRIEALVELAKFKEHRCRDFASAEALTREAIALDRKVARRVGVYDLAPGALEKRLVRLLHRRRRCALAIPRDGTDG